MTAPTLTEFLLARIAADEAAADDVDWDDYNPLHQPARVLAECEAKRRIVERERWKPPHGMDCDGHPGAWMPHGDYGAGYCMWGAEHDGEQSATLRDLAAVYADHPDYRNEWRP